MPSRGSGRSPSSPDGPANPTAAPGLGESMPGCGSPAIFRPRQTRRARPESPSTRHLARATACSKGPRTVPMLFRPQQRLASVDPGLFSTSTFPVLPWRLCSCPANVEAEPRTELAEGRRLERRVRRHWGVGKRLRCSWMILNRPSSLSSTRVPLPWILNSRPPCDPSQLYV